MSVFFDVSVLDYEKVGQGDPLLESKDALVVATRAADLGAIFRANYQRAEEIAQQVKGRSNQP
jgi:aminoglycoside phosphotransferase (APT) family kinase protein